MEKKLSLKIAMIGSRGLPIIYGGIERHVAEVSTRLARFGHDVTVFGRRPYSRNAVIDGVKVRAIPAIHTKNLETATNSFLSTINACMGDFDIIHFHGVGPSIFSLFPWALRKKAVATIHAPDYRQSKWGPVARYFLKAGERNALRFCRASITVSKTMFNQLKNEAEYPIYYIPNGATIKSPVALEEAKKFGIEPGKYILAVGRFIAEKGFLTLIDAFLELDSELKLVIAGGSSFEHDYARKLKRRSNDRVIFTGYASGELLDELYSNCLFYCLTSTLEGLPISLIEAMSFGKPVVASDIEESLEVAEGTAVIFKRGDKEDLARAMRYMLSLSPEEREKLGNLGREKVRNRYNWDRIAEEIEGVYRSVL